MRVARFSFGVVGLLIHLNFQVSGYQLQVADVISSSGMYLRSSRDRRICLSTNFIPSEIRGRFGAPLGASTCRSIGRKITTLSRFEATGFRKTKTGVLGMGMADYMFGMEGISLQPGDRAFIVGADIKRDK
jgi:hypothetical protein